ncbi:hypothetical protein AVHY2522_16700 [Acidovorax sp. SUPP2522]|uniref:hypothetical protein n=2 Tax=unclassified Acidovorax TaxID=2684926 RepID=UPI0023DE2A03|nr:hypothetical protein [Acidovorax sp. SUPP2522]GKT17865.1 hypothetical protein AVHY2522_16700 [Acidovorax sp. SUPP2522]
MPDALPAGIEIFRLDLDLQADAQQALQHLTPEERSRAWRYVRRADRVRFAQTRNAVRCLLGSGWAAVLPKYRCPWGPMASLSWMRRRSAHRCSTSRIRETTH